MTPLQFPKRRPQEARRLLPLALSTPRPPDTGWVTTIRPGYKWPFGGPPMRHVEAAASRGASRLETNGGSPDLRNLKTLVHAYAVGLRKARDDCFAA